jgi:hypothetical protein
MLLKVATVNLSKGVDRWGDRMPLVCAGLETTLPDIVGFRKSISESIRATGCAAVSTTFAPIMWTRNMSTPSTIWRTHEQMSPWKRSRS